MRARLLGIAEALDAFRVVPRVLVVLYGFMCWRVAQWFMGLDEPSAPQSAFVSVIWGAAAAWFGLYVNSGRRWDGVALASKHTAPSAVPHDVLYGGNR